MTGNSLAYLLSQEQKCATADVRVVQMRKVSLTGNSLAYLLSQEQKCATADVHVLSNRRPDIRPQGQFGWRSAA
jgi:hypothetical protein